jgi:hypothetical protein
VVVSGRRDVVGVFNWDDKPLSIAIDLASEAWDGPKRILRGVSRVVGGDPYEIRVLIPATAETWQEGASPLVSPADVQVGVTIRSKQAKGLLKRYVIESPFNREV